MAFFFSLILIIISSSVTKPNQTKPKYIQRQNVIDLDQEAMEETIALGTSDSSHTALAIFTQSRFSKSVAEVQFSQPISTNIWKGEVKAGKEECPLSVTKTTLVDKLARSKWTDATSSPYDLKVILISYR